MRKLRKKVAKRRPSAKGRLINLKVGPAQLRRYKAKARVVTRGNLSQFARLAMETYPVKKRAAA